MSISNTIQIQVNDPCNSTLMSYSPAITNMLAYVNVGADIQTAIALDSASTTYGAMDGTTLCGPRSY